MKIIYYDEAFEWKNPEDLYRLCLIQQRKIKNKDKVINDLLKRISDLEFEVEKQEQRIDKAIEYLKENACIDEDVEYFCDDLRYDECKELLNILKGVAKE